MKNVLLVFVFCISATLSFAQNFDANAVLNQVFASKPNANGFWRWKPSFEEQVNFKLDGDSYLSKLDKIFQYSADNQEFRVITFYSDINGDCGNCAPVLGYAFYVYEAVLKQWKPLFIKRLLAKNGTYGRAYSDQVPIQLQKINEGTYLLAVTDGDDRQGVVSIWATYYSLENGETVFSSLLKFNNENQDGKTAPNYFSCERTIEFQPQTNQAAQIKVSSKGTILDMKTGKIVPTNFTLTYNFDSETNRYLAASSSTKFDKKTALNQVLGTTFINTKGYWEWTPSLEENVNWEISEAVYTELGTVLEYSYNGQQYAVLTFYTHYVNNGKILDCVACPSIFGYAVYQYSEDSKQWKPLFIKRLLALKSLEGILGKPETRLQEIKKGQYALVATAESTTFGQAYIREDYYHLTNGQLIFSAVILLDNSLDVGNNSPDYYAQDIKLDFQATNNPADYYTILLTSKGTTLDKNSKIIPANYTQVYIYDRESNRYIKK